ncbi:MULTISPECIES: hypothetical protein [Sphingomonas]|uniref:Uncharacterized protein n=1 Tax=Sphingomonas lycopersici TaxID=2951807 RepID=A0AA41Z9N1_9SPHN|nr:MULTISPECIES: hypothetical protein [Sphingomonas]MCW6532757.1 hypothetical protein [Sphingomonas lycopersici]MCW6536565.1 hypothetical protein [Sphingomonas lycopersici]OJU18562.1 MAG: hypothetical protein BGN95_15220 [Sphingomonas sp. 66-10]
MPQPARRQDYAREPRQVSLPEPRWIAGDGGDSPVRELHGRLLEAFGTEGARRPANEKLSLTLRVATIVGASIALWAVIGGVIYALI